MDLWSMGLAAYRRAHMPQYSLSALVRLPEVSERLVQAASLMTVRKWAADREAAEDGLSCHRLSGETAELERPTTRVRAKLQLRKKPIALNPPLENQRFYALPPVQSTIFRALALAFDPWFPLDAGWSGDQNIRILAIVVLANETD
jgi:hypothetical protein